MTELDRALSELEYIQSRLAASTRFRGFAPQAVALTGLLALAMAAAQTLVPALGAADGTMFVVGWTLVAAIATALVGIEAHSRSRRLHGGMADTMLAGTLRTLLPFGVAGALVTFIIMRVSPESIWVLPGLWQVLIALAGFSATTLPPRIGWAAGWYLGCGALVLVLAGRAGMPTPWMMGVPFGLGQLLVAWVLHRAAGEA